MPASFEIRCSCAVKFRRSFSFTCCCWAKQAIAQTYEQLKLWTSDYWNTLAIGPLHTLTSMPVWNCLPRISHTPWFGSAVALFRPPYCSFGADKTRPFTSVMAELMAMPNSWANGSAENSAFLTRLAISRSRSGAERAVACKADVDVQQSHQEGTFYCRCKTGDAYTIFKCQKKKTWVFPILLH